MLGTRLRDLFFPRSLSQQCLSVPVSEQAEQPCDWASASRPQELIPAGPHWSVRKGLQSGPHPAQGEAAWRLFLTFPLC